MNKALQYAGADGHSTISLQKFWAFNIDLVASPLKIQYATDSGKVVSRDSSKVEEPGGALTIKRAAQHFGVNQADPSLDSPDIEIRANYTTNAPTSYVASQANVGDLAASFHAATTADALTAWLVANFKDRSGVAMPSAAAAAYAALVYPAVS